ncbi:MAG: tetratricopeptide repeat protein [Flavobacteriales bacterium]
MAKQTTDDTILNVQEVYGKAESFMDKNRKPVMVGGGIIIAAIVGFFAYQFLYKAPKEKEAANASWRAFQFQEVDSAAVALNGAADFAGFEEIANKYSGTKTGKIAHYWCGINYRDMGEYEKALEHFKQADFDDEALGVISMGNVGDMYVQLGNNEEGASWLDKAAKKAGSSAGRNYLAPQYILKASKVYMELGQDDRAISLLKDLTDNYDNKSQEWGEGTRLLAMLKAKKS